MARELQLTGDDTIVSRHQQRYLDEKASSLQTWCYPMRLVEQGATRLLQVSEIGEGTVEYLKTALNLAQAGYRDTITVRAPDSNETAFFGLPDDGRVSVFETWRTVFDTTGKAIQLTVGVYPADRSEFVINVGDVPRQCGGSAAPGGGRRADQIIALPRRALRHTMPRQWCGAAPSGEPGWPGSAPGKQGQPGEGMD